MNSISIIVLVVVAVVAVNAGDLKKPYYNVNEAPELFEKFVKDYNRNYKNAADRQAHYDAFVESLHAINKSNKESDSAVFDINNFADYTPSERKNMFGLRLPRSH